MLQLFQIYKDFYLFDIQNNFIFLALYFTIILDIITGHLKAWANKEFKSKTSRQGIVTHGLLLLVLNVVYPVFVYLNMDEVIKSFMLLLIWPYLASIVENYKEMGGLLPKEVDDWINRKRKR